MPKLRRRYRKWAVGLLGRWWLRRQAGPISDERDEEISRRAQLLGYRVFWIVMITTTVFLPLAGLLPDVIPSRALLLVPIAGMVVLEGTRSIAALVLYARGT